MRVDSAGAEEERGEGCWEVTSGACAVTAVDVGAATVAVAFDVAAVVAVELAVASAGCWASWAARSSRTAAKNSRWLRT